MSRVLLREVPLGALAEVGLRNDEGSSGNRQLNRPIGAQGIDHHNVITDPLQGGDARLDLVFLIERDDGAGDVLHTSSDEKILAQSRVVSG